MLSGNQISSTNKNDDKIQLVHNTKNNGASCNGSGDTTKNDDPGHGEKAFKGYFGGKNGSGVYQTIINLIPPHKVYIEGFLGNGTIMRLKKKADYSYGIEVDKNVLDAWKKVPKQCIIYNIDFVKFVNDRMFRYLFSSYEKNEVFIYLDPPYPVSSIKSNRAVYRYTMTDKEHIDLLKLITALPFNIAISTYDNPIYQEHLKGWNKKQFKAKTQKYVATETVYFNYPEPADLHDYRYLGKNFRERERITKKINRHVERLKRLPILEMKAIVKAINDIS